MVYLLLWSIGTTVTNTVSIMRHSIQPAKLIFILFALITLGITAFFFQKYSPEIIHLVNRLGWLAPILFLIIYCIATIMFLPTMVITLAGGALFGPLMGTLLNLFGATWGAACCFLITRHLIADWFSRKKGVKLSKLIGEVEQKGWLFVAFLRLFPIIPFNVVNYGMGVTRIKFRTYLITTFIFLIPAEIVYTYFGYAGMDALLNQGAFYRKTEIIISGLAVAILCFIKLGLVNVTHFRLKHTKKSLNIPSSENQ